MTFPTDAKLASKLLKIVEYKVDPRRPDDETILFGKDAPVWVAAAVAALQSGVSARDAIREADTLLNAYRYRHGSGLELEQIRGSRAIERDYP